MKKDETKERNSLLVMNNFYNQSQNGRISY